jgi:hypothetical protein
MLPWSFGRVASPSGFGPAAISFSARRRQEGTIVRFGIIAAAGVTLLVSACAWPIQHIGPAGSAPRAAAADTFVIPGVIDAADNESAVARDAVRRQLIARGWREDASATVRVEIGFAIAPKSLETIAPDDRPVRPVAISVAACRRWRYTLSVALVDRRDGRTVFQGGATTLRCGRSDGKAIDRLAEAAFDV